MSARLLSRSVVALLATAAMSSSALAESAAALPTGPGTSVGCTVSSSLIGTSRVGQTLVAPTPSFSGFNNVLPTVTYAWYRASSGGAGGDQQIPGATQASYKLAPVDAGRTIYLLQTGSALLGTLKSVTCGKSSSAVVQAASTSSSGGGSGSGSAGSGSSGSGSSGSGSTSVTPVPAVTPAISGSPFVGGVLVSGVAAPVDGARVAGYQWYVIRNVNGHARWTKMRISGAHHRWMKVRKGLLGQRVLVGVTYVKAGMKPRQVFSSPVRIKKERRRED